MGKAHAPRRPGAEGKEDGEMSKDELAISYLLRDLRASRDECDVMRQTLTRCQAQCTELVEQNRALHKTLERQLELSMKSLETQSNLLTKMEAIGNPA